MRTRKRHAKTKQTLDVDVLPRRGKQHSAVQQTFGKQSNAILSVLQREFVYNTLTCGVYLSTRYKCTIHSVSQCFHMPHSHSHSDVNAALQIIILRPIRLGITCLYPECRVEPNDFNCSRMVHDFIKKLNMFEIIIAVQCLPEKRA